MNDVILRPLPFANPDRLVQVFGTPAGLDTERVGAGR
jgi:hypothetical protein